jgi:hypothetical protein
MQIRITPNYWLRQQMVQALQQISSSSARSVLEWHMDKHAPSLVSMLCIDHIALPQQGRQHMLASHIDFGSDEPSTDEDMEVGTALDTACQFG